jgi:hypothetical protein
MDQDFFRDLTGKDHGSDTERPGPDRENHLPAF